MRLNPFSGGPGCGRFLLAGGGCLAVVVIGMVGIIAVGGTLWERGTDALSNRASDVLSDRFGSDISGRADLAEERLEDLPEPGLFQDTDAYLQFLESHNRELARTIEELGRLLANARPNDDQWSDGVAEQIAVVRKLRDQAEDASPPPGLEDVHRHWLESLDGLRHATDTTARAIDDVSPSGLGEAIRAMDTATRSYIVMAESLQERGLLDELDAIEDLDSLEQP